MLTISLWILNSTADTSTLRTIYLTCKYACQLWDPHTIKDIESLESVQKKFACKVCLKKWDMNYKDMLTELDIPSLSLRRHYLKLTTLHSILYNYSYFPANIFTYNFSPYTSNRSLNLVKPVAHTNYFLHSFVPRLVLSLFGTLFLFQSISFFKYII